MSKPARLPLAPPHGLAHGTTATLSPRINTGSTSDAGLSPASSSITQAVATIPRSSSRLMVTVQVSRSSAFRFNAIVKSIGRPYRQYTLYLPNSCPRLKSSVRYMMRFRRALKYGVTGRNEGVSYLQKLVVYCPLLKQEVGVKLTAKGHCEVLIFLCCESCRLVSRKNLHTR